MEFHKLLRYSLISGSIAILAACSSADTATTPVTPVTPTTVTISGSIFASDVGSASVTVKKTDGTTVAGPVTTNSDGTYSIDLLDTDLATDLVVESTGGGFVDEETDLNATAGSMSAYVEGGSLAAGDSVHVTPGTTIHADLITNHGKTPTEAQTTFFTAFAYNPDYTVDPVDITDPASNNADDASKLAGWRAAVLSRLASDLGLTPEQQFDMFAAMAQDLSDGDMDGADASGPVLVGSTGVTTPTLANYISTTDSFNTAEIANLEITYSPPNMNVHGKNVFKLTIMNTTGGGAATPVTGLVPGTDLMVMPMMYMADRIHSTPMGGITELGNGEYEVTAYYLMPSRMMDGTTMGTWDLKVTANMQTVHFYPNIDMAMMNNTVRVQLKGVDDTIIDMNGLEVPRNYNLFRDGLSQQSTGSTYDFDVFIAPMENMMSFPALVDGMTLTSGMGGTPYDVNGITVEASVDGGITWNTGSTGVTDGVWSFNDLNLNITPGFTNEIRVKLMVSGETKTDGGLATDPDFQTFNVTF
jgi:hypothetical protein